jgi:hypothetical protein
MREHPCLHDVLPLPTTISLEFKECTAVRLEFVVSALDIVRDREAAMASGNRVSIRRMQEVIHVRLHIGCISARNAVHQTRERSLENS